MSSSRAARSKRTEVETESLSPTFAAAPGALVSGRIVERRSDGSVFVDFAQNTLGPLSARTLTQDAYLGATVLLGFDGSDPTRPIILGILHDRVRNDGEPLHLKASRIVFEAKEELTVQCGESSIETRRDGKVSIKGRDVLSRATRSNKIRGATVMIN
jgi:hypothetical protein